MERLTYKNYIEEYEVNFEKNSEKQWSIAESDTHIKVTGEPIDKLAEFEDFIEEQGCDGLEQFKRVYNEILDENIKENEKINNLLFENQALKSRWQKLKEWVVNRWADLPEVWQKMEELEKEIN